MFPNMKVTSLSDLNDSPLLLACRKENLLALTKDWNQLLSDYQILYDLWSDTIEARGTLLTLLDELNRKGETAQAFPAPVSRFDRFIILVCEKYFSKRPEFRLGTIVHELGHFYVYRKKLLERLRNLRDSSDPFFTQFIAPIRSVHQEWPSLQKRWARETLFNINVLDVLKIPGEVFANLWVKGNFEGMFVQVVKSQLEEYKLAQKGKEKIHGTFGWRALIRFHMFSLILRLDGLSLLAEDVLELEGAIKELQEFRESCWNTLQEFAHHGEFETFRSYEKEIIDASSSLRGSNEALPDIFKEFLKKVPLRTEDFAS